MTMNNLYHVTIEHRDSDNEFVDDALLHVLAETAIEAIELAYAAAENHFEDVEDSDEWVCTELELVEEGFSE
jgi:hypothetical protein